MTVDEALAILDAVLQQEHLSDVQELVFRQCWEGRTYQEMAEDSSYDAGYIKDVGSKLWKFLSDAFGEKVTKGNVQSVLRRHYSLQEPGGSGEQKSKKIANGNSEGLVLSSESTLETRSPTAQNLELNPQPPTLPPVLRCDWGEAIDVTTFYGRVEELATLTHWIVSDRCRLILLLGMGGIGKTSLSVKLAEQLQGSFEYLIWRSLRNAPH